MTVPTVVTVVHGRSGHLRRQQHWLERWAPEAPRVVVALGDPAVEDVLGARPGVQVVHVPSSVERLQVARGRNVGAACAFSSGAESVVFLDVDCLPSPGLVTRYDAHLRDGVLLSGPVTYLDAGVLPPDDADESWFADHRSPHPARPDPPAGEVLPSDDPDLFWSLSFCVTAPTWERLGGFHEEYEGYGAEDTDLAWTARARGIDLAWVGGADALHQHHPVSSPPVEHVADIVRNGRIFHRRWGTWPMRGWLEELARTGAVRREGEHWCVVPRP